MVAYPAANISFTPPLLSFIYLFADPDLSWKSTCLFVNQEGVILFWNPRINLDFHFSMMTKRGRISRWHLWFLPSDIIWDYVRGRFSAMSCQSKEFSFCWGHKRKVRDTRSMRRIQYNTVNIEAGEITFRNRERKIFLVDGPKNLEISELNSGHNVNYLENFAELQPWFLSGEYLTRESTQVSPGFWPIELWENEEELY